MNRQKAIAKYLDPPFRLDADKVWHKGKPPVSVADKSGVITRRSWNLAGLRKYVGKSLIEHVHVREIPEYRAVLTILFADGSWSQALFESASALANSLRKWRNLYGAPLFWLDIRKETRKGIVAYSDAILRRKAE